MGSSGGGDTEAGEAMIRRRGIKGSLELGQEHSPLLGISIDQIDAGVLLETSQENSPPVQLLYPHMGKVSDVQRVRRLAEAGRHEESRERWEVR